MRQIIEKLKNTGTQNMQKALNMKPMSKRFKNAIYTSCLGALAVMFIASPAIAACTSPASPEGGLAYFTVDDTYRLCNGADAWIPVGASGTNLWTDNTTHISREDIHVINAASDSTAAGLDGVGTYSFYANDKSALRGGEINAVDNINAWQATQIGANSFAWGRNAEANGAQSAAFGSYTAASGDNSLAFGSYAYSQGGNSFAGGNLSRSFNSYGFTYGQKIWNFGTRAVAFGLGDASGVYPQISALGNESFVVFMGDQVGADMVTPNTVGFFGGSMVIDHAQPATQLAPDASSALDITSTTKGFLPPRMSTAQRDAIATPATGLTIYNTTTNTTDYYNGAAWTSFATTAGSALWTDNTTHITRENIHILDAGATMTSAGFDGGIGNAFVWHTDKRALRVGGATGTQWDETNIGTFSFAVGENARASGYNSTALNGSWATGSNSVAMIGGQATATGALGIGDGAAANAASSVVIGRACEINPAGVDSKCISLDNTYRQLLAPNVMAILGGQLAVGTVAPAASSLIDLTSTTQGFLPPRMSTAQRDAIGTPATGLTIYNTTTNTTDYYNGAAWTSFATTAGSALWTDNTTHITRENIHILDAGATMTSAGFDGISGNFAVWHDDKGAFRAGQADPRWNEANIGVNSAAFGYRTQASGSESFAAGNGAMATGDDSAAFGSDNTASGARAFVTGFQTLASGAYSTAFGERVGATGTHSAAFGLHSAYQTIRPIVSGARSMAIFMDGGVADANSTMDMTASDTFAVIGGDLIIGSYQMDDTTTGNEDVRMFFDRSKGAFRAGTVTETRWDDGQVGTDSVAMGNNTSASGNISTAFGNWTTASGQYSTAIGENTVASGGGSTAIGSRTIASGGRSTTIGREVIAGSGTPDGTYTLGAGHGHNTFAIGLQSASQATDPIITGDRSMAIFMDGNVVDANSALDVTASDVFVLYGGRMGIGTVSPDASSILDITSTTQGFLPPRMTTAQRDLINAGTFATGLTIYNTTTNMLQYYDGAAWQNASAAGGLAVDDLSDGVKNLVENNFFLGHEGGVGISANNLENTGVGIGALDSLTDPGALPTLGNYNTALGYNAGTAVTTGYYNSLFGNAAGDNITTGSSNSAIGTGALSQITGERNNTAVGSFALTNTTGDNNSVLGASAGSYLRNGSGNILIGRSAGRGEGISYNYDGIDNVIIGRAAAIDLDATNNQNTIIGATAAAGLTGGGSDNILLGFGVDVPTATTSNYLNIGDVITGDMVTGDIAIIGTAALTLPTGTTAQRPTTGVNGMIRYDSDLGKFQGYQAGTWSDIITTGAVTSIDDLTDGKTNATSRSIFLGAGGGAANPGNLARESVFLGYEAGNAMGFGIGDQNTAVGYQALYTATGGDNNTAFGWQSLLNTQNASGNSGFGSGSLSANTSGENNTAVGSGALYTNSAKSRNTALGAAAMFYADSTTTNGSIGNNTAIGFSALYGSTTAANNTGVENTAIGASSLSANTSGSNNTVLGYNAGLLNTTGANNILIGSGVDAPTNATSNHLNIGGTIYGDLSSDRVGIGQVPAAGVELDVLGDIEYTGTITDVSDMRLKENIVPLTKDGSLLEKIDQIDTYSFTMKDEKDARTEYGVMAQELEKIFPTLVHTAFDEMGTKSVNYVGLIAPMIEATKELRAENTALKSEISDLKLTQIETANALSEISEQVALLNKVTSSNVGKASMQNYLILLLGLFGLLGGVLIISRKKSA